jgi:hypothetical protein
MSNTLTTRLHSIVLICALVAVMGTCAIVLSHVSLAAVSAACHGVSSGGAAPVGYTMP